MVFVSFDDEVVDLEDESVCDFAVLDVAGVQVDGLVVVDGWLTKAYSALPK